MNNNMINHICSRLRTVDLEKKPWSHKYIDNIFPEEIYSKILLNLPSTEFYKSRTEMYIKAKESNYSAERYEFKIDMNNLNLLSESSKNFWLNLYRDLCAKEIQSTVLNIFKDTIDYRMNNLTDHEKNKIGIKNYKFTMLATIVKDFKKYHLGAHTDNPKKLITFLFYLPKDMSLENLGTSIYECKPNVDPLKLEGHLTAEDTMEKFIKVKTCKFVPNSLLIFPRTNYTFHGVDEVNMESNERDLLLFNYYIYGEK